MTANLSAAMKRDCRQSRRVAERGEVRPADRLILAVQQVARNPLVVAWLMTSLWRCGRRRLRSCCCCCCCLTIGHRPAAKANYKRPTTLASRLLAAKTSESSNGWRRCAADSASAAAALWMLQSARTPCTWCIEPDRRHKRPTWLAVDRSRTVMPCDVYKTKRRRAPAVTIWNMSVSIRQDNRRWLHWLIHYLFSAE